MDEQESLGACFKDAEYSKEWKEIYYSVGRFDKKNRAFFPSCAEKLKGYSIGLQECCALQSMDLNIHLYHLYNTCKDGTLEVYCNSFTVPYIGPPM